MTIILTKKAPPRETQNTFNLPTGADIRDELVQIFGEQRTAVLGYLDQSKAWDALELKWGLPIAWPSWDSLGLGVLNLVERLEDSIKSIWEKAGAGFLALLGLDPDGWDANDPKNIALIQQGLQDLATEVNDTTSEQLQQALNTVAKEVTDGKITADQAEAELTKDVNDIFDNAEDWRAKMIAVTEASRAYHQAIAAAAREFGEVSGWQWKTNGDPCGICLEIEAECQFVPDGRPFAIIGDNPTYQEIDMPPAHPGCMCTADPVMAGDEPPDWGTTLIQPTGKKGYALEPAVIGIKAFPVPKRQPRPGRFPISRKACPEFLASGSQEELA